MLTSNLISNIDVEYYIWYYFKHGTGGMHYRFNPLTGAIYKSNDMGDVRSYDTYYICDSKHPIYDVNGVYIGMQYADKFVKPISVSDMCYNRSSVVYTTPWEQMKKVLESSTGSSIEEKTGERQVVGCEYTYNGIDRRDSCANCMFSPLNDSCNEFAREFTTTLIYDE